MRATEGDQLVQHGRIVGQHDKVGEITQVLHYAPEVVQPVRHRRIFWAEGSSIDRQRLLEVCTSGGEIPQVTHHAPEVVETTRNVR